MARQPDPQLPRLFDAVLGKDLVSFLSWVKIQLSSLAPVLVTIRNITEEYTLTYDDRTGYYFRCDYASDTDLNIPADSDVNFPIGTRVPFRQVGAGKINFVAGTGVTLNYLTNTKSLGTNTDCTLTKVAANEWDLGKAS